MKKKETANKVVEEEVEVEMVMHRQFETTPAQV